MKNPNKYQSILVIVVGFLVLYYIFNRDYDWGFMTFKRQYFLNVAITVGVLSLMFEFLADAILKGWMKVGEVLGFINTRILLSLIFFVFLFPFAILQRLFSKGDNLQLKNKQASVFEARDHEYKPEDFDNIW
jgi:hypothetical protein